MLADTTQDPKKLDPALEVGHIHIINLTLDSFGYLGLERAKARARRPAINKPKARQALAQFAPKPAVFFKPREGSITKTTAILL